MESDKVVSDISLIRAVIWQISRGITSVITAHLNLTHTLSQTLISLNINSLGRPFYSCFTTCRIFMPLFLASQTIIHLPRLVLHLYFKFSILRMIKSLRFLKRMRHNSAVSVGWLKNRFSHPSYICLFFLSGPVKRIRNMLCLCCKIISYSHFMCII